MSSLFKDPVVTKTYLNLNHAQSNSRKKRPKKIKLPQMNFFLKKQLIKFHVPISHFHSAKFCLEEPQRSVKIKCNLIFISIQLSEMQRTERLNLSLANVDATLK